MGRRLSLDDPDHCWSRAQEAKADAECMPDPDTRRLALAVAENYEQLARHLEVRERRQRYTPVRVVQLQHHPDRIAGRSNDEGHAAEKGKEFYVRVGNTTKSLDPADTHAYLAART
jgi:hypothetical protein